MWLEDAILRINHNSSICIQKEKIGMVMEANKQPKYRVWQANFLF
jgi:hypothetical protein